MASKNIHVVGITSRFNNPAELLKRVKTELAEFKEKTVFIVFPEGVLGKNPISNSISRKEGKSLANSLHELVRAHGSAYIAYSSIEKARINSPHRVNAGYLVTPRKQKGLGYQVYPKITTYNKGANLTEFDGMYVDGYNNHDTRMEAVRRRVKKVRYFPEVTINGKKVQLRICADAQNLRNSQYVQDSHSARKRKSNAHLILAPASAITLRDSDIDHIFRNLVVGGHLVLTDGYSREVKRVSKLKPDLYEKRHVSRGDIYKKKGFVIHHKR